MNLAARSRWVCIARWILAAWFCIGAVQAQTVRTQPTPPARPLLVDEVLASVVSRYPPLLAALIEQDIASGRLRQAEGAFDLNLNAGMNSTPLGYYDGRTGSVILEQALQSWGAKVYGGYRLGSGFLPNYNLMRTPAGGQLTAGVKINLLRDGRIDKDRAAQAQARLGEAAADPFIARQRLDFVRTATIAYFNWLGAGLRLSAAEELLRVANDRDAAVAEQVKRGALAPIVRVDNERLVISRKLAAIQAQRRFEATAIELSLFLRDGQDRPSIATRDRLPPTFPGTVDPDGTRLQRDIADAVARRPETRGIALSIEQLKIERDLAQNELLPSLDVGIEARQSPMQRRQPDIEALETRLGVEFNVPLQRRAAAGRLKTVEGQILRLRTEEQFMRERIENEVRDAYSALTAVISQITQARRNVVLAETLEQAERLRFSQGATDLFALQIREQATFDARLGEIDAFNEYQRALANYRAAVANDGQEAGARR